MQFVYIRYTEKGASIELWTAFSYGLARIQKWFMLFAWLYSAARMCAKASTFCIIETNHMTGKFVWKSQRKNRFISKWLKFQRNFKTNDSCPITSSIVDRESSFVATADFVVNCCCCCEFFLVAFLYGPTVWLPLLFLSIFCVSLLSVCLLVSDSWSRKKMIKNDDFRSCHTHREKERRDIL